MSEKKYIQSIERSSLILEYIADKGTAKLNEISEATGLKTSTAFGIIQTPGTYRLYHQMRRRPGIHSGS